MSSATVIARVDRQQHRLSLPPGEQRVSVDWSRRLRGGVILSSVWDLPAGIAGSSQAIIGDECGVALSGWAAGERHRVTNTITTLDGATLSTSLLIKIDADAPAPTPRNRSTPSMVVLVPAGDDLIEMHVPTRPHSDGPVLLTPADNAQVVSNPDADGVIEFQLPPGFQSGIYRFAAIDHPIDITPDAAESIGARAAGVTYRHDRLGELASVHWTGSYWRLYHGLLEAEDPESPEPDPDPEP